MKKPMLNAMQKVRMSTAMASKKPKLNPGFDSLPKEVRMKILKSKKPKMAMMKKPLKSDPSDKKITKKTQKSDKKLIQAMVALDKGKVNKALRKYKAGTRKAYKAGIISKAQKQKAVKDAIYNKPANKPKMAMKKPTLSSKSTKKKEIAKYNISGFVSKHTGLKPGRYEKAVIMNGVRNAAPSRRKKVLQQLKTNAGTEDMFKKPKLSKKKKAIDRKKKAIVRKVDKSLKGKKFPKNVFKKKQGAILKKQQKINDYSQ
jgi:hypothetical protein